MNPSIKPTVELLKEVKLLKAFTDQELQNLIRLGEVKSYEAHANIVIEGELTWGLYFILDGFVGIYKQNKLTTDVFDVGQLKTGNFFGEMSLIDNAPRSATVKSLANSQLFHLSKDAFFQFLDKSTNLKLKFYESCVKTLSQRLRELDDNYVIGQYQLWKTALKKEAA